MDGALDLVIAGVVVVIVSCLRIVWWFLRGKAVSLVFASGLLGILGCVVCSGLTLLPNRVTFSTIVKLLTFGSNEASILLGSETFLLIILLRRTGVVVSITETAFLVILFILISVETFSFPWCNEIPVRLALLLLILVPSVVTRVMVLLLPLLSLLIVIATGAVLFVRCFIVCRFVVVCNRLVICGFLVTWLGRNMALVRL